MNRPQISVIIPIYNTEKYIEKCCRSLFEQTLDDIEYIFIDDCSSDNSMSILKQVLEDYPNRKNRVKIIQQEQNFGVARARKDGIQLACGEYVIHCDSDDWVDLDMYRKLYRKAKEDNSDMVFCEYYTVKGDVVTRRRLPQITSKKQIISNLLRLKILIRLKTLTVLWRGIVRLNIVKNSEIDFPCDDMMEDLILNVQYAYFSEKISIINEPLYYHYHNPESICNNNHPMRPVIRCEQAKNNLEIIVRFLQKKGVSREFHDELILLKYNIRALLSPLISTHNSFYTKWNNTFPELNAQLFFSKAVSVKYKAFFFLMHIRVYPFFKLIYNKLFPKKLLSY